MENESNKQTAVQWLWEQIDEILPFSVDTETGIKLYNAKEQAKKIEKQQIMDARNNGFEISGEGWNGEYGIEDFNKLTEEIKSEQYYNETYGDDKQ